MLVPPACRDRAPARRLPTIVVAHEHSGVLELIEASLRDRGGARVLATLDSLEVLEIVRRLKVDLLVISHALNDVGDVRASQPDLPVLVLDDEPMSLDEIADAVVAALAVRD